MEKMKINYIDEINAFHDWCLENKLSPSACLLWFSLMHFCNQSRWKKYFNVALSDLRNDTHLSKRTIQRNRDKLVEAGLIKVSLQSGGRAAIYSMVPFSRHSDTSARHDDTSRCHSDTSARHDDTSRCHSDTSARHSDAIHRQTYKTYKTVDGNSASEKNVHAIEAISYYQENIHPLQSTTEYDLLLALVKEHGVDMCKKAIDRAVFRKKRSIQYIGGILRRWQQDGYDEPEGESGKKPLPPEVENIPF